MIHLLIELQTFVVLTVYEELPLTWSVYRLQERCWARPVSDLSVLVIEYNLQSQSKHPIPQTGQAAYGSVLQETLQLWLSDL